MATAKQRRASERNWDKGRVAGALGMCKHLQYKGRSAVERERAKKAACWLELVLRDWDKEEHK